MEFKQFLAEGVYEILPSDIEFADRDEFRVYINPTVDEMRALNHKPIRAILDPGGDIFAWHESYAVHQYVKNKLDIRGINLAFYYIKGKNTYMIYIGNIGQKASDFLKILRSNKNINNMLKHSRYETINDPYEKI